jgi:hypothetical protein
VLIAQVTPNALDKAARGAPICPAMAARLREGLYEHFVTGALAKDLAALDSGYRIERE